MPFNYQYLIEKSKFDNRVLSELQHRIRVPLKAYSVSEFKLGQDNSFEYKVSFSKRQSGQRVVVPSKKTHHGSFLKEDASDTEYRITLTFND